MKTAVLFFMISFLTITGSNSQQVYKFTDDKSVLDFYKQYSPYTDPGEFAYLYENLPDSLPELCSLIKSQFIHPYAELPYYKDQIPEERWDEMFDFPTVKSILEKLVLFDSSGITLGRNPKDQLVVGCRENAILLASILKYRGIPARVRCGHATYLISGFHASHTLCEVWNEIENRWMLVDPEMHMIDFNSQQFDFSNDAWLQLHNDEINPDIYGNPGQYTGAISIVGKISPDLASILGTEYPIYQYAPILDFISDTSQLTAEQMDLLDTISNLMKSLDANNLNKLQELYNNTPEIQMTKTFEIDTTNNDNITNIEEKTIYNNCSLNQNFPNPFNHHTIITFSVYKEGLVTLNIYNTLGKYIETLINEKLFRGIYKVEFNAYKLPPGTYFYELRHGALSQIKKMTLSR